MKKFLLCFAALGLTAAVLADQSVYSTKLGDGWANWSWAKVTLAGKIIKVDSKDWQGVYFHHADQEAKKFSAVTFKVNGGATGGQRLQVMATVKGKGVKEAYLPALAGGGKWSTVTVTFAQLGLTNQKFDGFWIQAQKACTYQVSDVALKSK